MLRHCTLREQDFPFWKRKLGTLREVFGFRSPSRPARIRLGCSAFRVGWNHDFSRFFERCFRCGFPQRHGTLRPAYERAVQRLCEAGLVYECYCTRREIQEASSAPHGAPGAYPGTCRGLSEAQREERRAQRPPALRLRAERTSYTVHDDFYGPYTGLVDDFVLVRNDGTYAYNLTSVVDDAFVGVEQIVRGDDLLPSAPRQAYLAGLLGLPQPRYAHVPLALNEEGKRLAKRDGAVTLPQLQEAGVTIPEVLGWIAASIPVLDDSGRPHEARVPVPDASVILERFDPALMSREPWVVRNL